MNCLCCLSAESEQRRSLHKSIKKYANTTEFAQFANLSLKTDSGRRKFIAQEIDKIGKGNISAQVFKYRDLCNATNNFSHDALIGEGGFGRVYKAKLNNMEVAIKQLDRNGFQGNKEFLVEVLVLSLIQHQHLVNLVGYCSDGVERVLVYEYLKNGSLEDHLLGKYKSLSISGRSVNLVGYCSDGVERVLVYEYLKNGSLEDHLLDIPPDKKPLDWDTRMKIASGAAKGLQYLHETANPPIIYRDFKASNILIDGDFNSKLSDFGLAKIGPTGGQTHISTRVMGTYGYCAPEYASTGKLTTKSDIYSFGVVFLELISGRRVIDKSRPSEEQNLVEWAQPLFKDKNKFQLMADPKLEGNYPMKSLYQALAIAAMCLQEEADTRPIISDVVVALDFISKDKTKEDNAEHKVKKKSRTNVEAIENSESNVAMEID